MLLSEAVATLQLQRSSVGGESDMLLAPFAQGQFLPFCLLYICSFHVVVHFSYFIICLFTRGLNASFSNLAGNPGYCQVQPLVAEQFEGEFNQLQDAVNESKGTLAPLSEGQLPVNCLL